MSNLQNEMIWKERLGAGAFGTVYRVRDPRFKHDVAVKCLKKSNLKSNGMREAVSSERNTLIALTQDNLSEHVVRLYACSQDNKYLYLEMELVKGETLAQKILNAGYLTHGQTRFYTAQLIAGIDFIHQAGILHRDLKPDNVMVTYREQVKIADFGLAKKLRPMELCYERCGTYGYMAPEIYGHRGYSYPADWYALGVMIFQMRVGSLSLDLLDYRNGGLIFQNLDNSITHYSRQGNLKPQTTRVIWGLTSPNPMERAEYAKKLDQRSFFSGIDWEHI